METTLAAANGCESACRDGERRALCALERWFTALGLAPVLAARLASGWRVNRYARGDVLFYQGNEPLALLFLCSGRVKLVRSDRSGRRQIIRIIHAPDMVGERALIARETYAASAEVMDEARVCVIDAARFLKFWSESPELVRAIARRLASKLGEADGLAVDLALHTVRQRLSKLIILKAESLPQQEASFPLTPSRRDLAELLGSAPEVVSRALRELARRKLIALEGQRVRVLDAARLRTASGLPARRLDLCQVFGAPPSSHPRTAAGYNRSRT